MITLKSHTYTVYIYLRYNDILSDMQQMNQSHQSHVAFAQSPGSKVTHGIVVKAWENHWRRAQATTTNPLERKKKGVLGVFRMFVDDS